MAKSNEIANKLQQIIQATGLPGRHRANRARAAPSGGKALQPPALPAAAGPGLSISIGLGLAHRLSETTSWPSTTTTAVSKNRNVFFGELGAASALAARTPLEGTYLVLSPQKNIFMF